MIFKMDHGHQVLTACDRLLETFMINQKDSIACSRCDHTVTLALQHELHTLPNIGTVNRDY